MTLGGLAIAIGEVVDDAIVDVENIIRRLRLNHEKVRPDPPLRVIYEASVEIRHAVVHATWIVLIVFIPIFLLVGVEGRIFTPLGLAYTFAFLASLVVTVTLVPALATLLLIRHGDAGSEQESLTVRSMKQAYETLLRRTLHHPRRVMAACALLVAASLTVIPFFGRSFLPEFREGNFILQVTMLPGVPLAESMRVARGKGRRPDREDSPSPAPIRATGVDPRDRCPGICSASYSPASGPSHPRPPPS